MNIQVRIKSQDSSEIINVEDVQDKHHFSYIDSYNANNEVDISDDGIDIARTSDTHFTRLHLHLHEKSFVSIMSDEGNLLFDAKVLALSINNDIITLVYSLNEETKSIEIKFVGVNI